MSEPSAELLHVLGTAAPGDPTTAAARALRDLLADEGHPGRIAALQVHGRSDDIDILDPGDLGDAPVVVHTVDGGDALAPALGPLRGVQSCLVHHGSRPGSDRSVLRSLRGAIDVAAAADPGAREELRGLGFGEPAALPPRALAGALADTDSPKGSDGHPGPHLLTVGPIAEGRSLELLVDAFAQLLRSGPASAVLSICGPAHAWYLENLMRRVLRRGLVACEVIEPSDEEDVRSRLRRCDVLVALQPAGLDPYLWHAAGRAAIVAPHVAATAELAGSPDFVEVDVAPTRDEVVRALQRAAAIDPRSGAASSRPPGTIPLSHLLGLA